MLWGAGDRPAALAVLAGSPRRQAVFALAADQPAAAAAALARLPDTDPARPVLTARLAWREGRLTDALRALEGAPGRQARRLHATLAPQQSHLAAPPASDTMIAGTSGPIGAKTARDHETSPAGRVGLPGHAPRGGEVIPGRVLHLVSDALPSTSAGYTIRTHEIAAAQRAAGLEPHVATRAGFPVTQGRIDGRRLVTLD